MFQVTTGYQKFDTFLKERNKMKKKKKTIKFNFIFTKRMDYNNVL